MANGLADLASNHRLSPLCGFNSTCDNAFSFHKIRLILEDLLYSAFGEFSVKMILCSLNIQTVLR